MKLLVSCDEPYKFSAEQDTTRAVIECAWSLGHTVAWFPATGIFFDQQLCVNAETLSPGSASDWCTVTPAPSTPVDSFDCVLVRNDPPVDTIYIRLCQLLGLASVPVFNSPSSLLLHNEKISALHFTELMPATILGKSDNLHDKYERQWGKGVYKSLDSLGGEGVFAYAESAREHARDFSQDPFVMQQQWISGVEHGDKRVILIDGLFAGVVLRVPPSGDFRSNFHVGGTPAQTSLTTKEQNIVETIGPWLQSEGIMLAGIDLVGEVLTEINITSPTGFREIQRLSNDDPATTLLKAIEDKIRA